MSDEDPASGPKTAPGNLGPLSYRSVDPVANNGPRLPSVVGICIFYGFLAIAMFGLGALLVYLAMERRGTPLSNPTGTLIGCTLFFGLGGVLVYWIVRYIRSVSSRK